MDGGVVAHLVTGALTGAATIGAFLYATRDHSRRLGLLEEKSIEHGEDISGLKAEMRLILPVKVAR